MKTHLAVSALVLIAAIIFFKAFFVPVLIGVVSHLLSDVPNIIKILKPA
jgi:hypothetical protein